MKLGIGIDTGGTYTDAVIYDFEGKSILHSTKSLTTGEDLAIGIQNALDQLPGALLKEAEIVSLSTTLATNACVEEKGGRGKLIFIGADKDVILRTGESYGLPGNSEMFFLDGEVDHRGQVVREPDWDAFVPNCEKWVADADAVAIVQQLGVRNASTELKTKELLTSVYGLNAICGHELFSDLNYIKRGASTLLNARLIPVIQEFLAAIKTSLRQRGIQAPVVIVRSDGSLMSETFTTVRPVETLLCGPAASVMGGTELTGEKDCLVIDMGGTTTDIAMVKNAVPVKAHDGVKVGKWQTFVKAVYIDTFGLGGDSRVLADRTSRLSLGTKRVTPLCIAAAQNPGMVTKLKNLIRTPQGSKDPQHEFFILLRDIEDSPRYDPEERLFCRALKEKGPLIYMEAAQTLGKRIFSSRISRLEKEGIIQRCGLTPTDMMHAKGHFDQFNAEASRLALDHLSQHLGRSPEELSEEVYDLVKEQLYFNIVRMLLEDKYPDLKRDGLDFHLEQLIRDGWKGWRTMDEESLLRLPFSVPVSLVGVGAPIHLFLPEVAAALGTKAVIPKNAGVANAVGAIVGNVSATAEITVKPDPNGGYIVFGKQDNLYTDDYQEALDLALEEAKRSAMDEAKKRGASGDISISTKRNYNEKLGRQIPEGMFLSTTISATAIGRVVL